MTIQEIQAQIDAAHAAPHNPDGTSNMWELLPRVYYKDLPAVMKKAVDKIYTVDKVKRFLLELYPVGALDGIPADEFEKKIKEALREARYIIESTDMDYGKDDPYAQQLFLVPISLVGAELAEAWNKISNMPAIPLSVIASKHLRKLDFPIDKLNNNVWKQLEEDMHGQLAIGMGGNQEVIYTISFDDLPVHITRRLEPFDKRVYVAAAALFNAGNAVISLTQIYNNMGNEGKPGQKTLERIADSITKMAAARVSINNEAEAAVTNYERFVYDAPLLPMERVQAFINSKRTEAAIHLFREPPLVSFARSRKQITTVDKKLLNTPLSKTNKTILIEDYLLERISRAKRDGKKAEKILLETLYREAEVTGKDKQRTPAKLEIILQHYVACKHISSFTLKEDCILLQM